MPPFNLTQAVVQASLTIILTVLIGLIVFYNRVFAQKQPDHQIPNLERFSKMAVKCVAYAHGNAIDKKSLATGLCADLFRSYKQPLPQSEAMDTAIEAALFETFGAEHADTQEDA